MQTSILNSRHHSTAAAAITPTTTTATPATAQRALTALRRTHYRLAVRVVVALAGASETRVSETRVSTGADAGTTADVGSFLVESIWHGLQLHTGAIQSLGASAAREAGGLVSQADEDGRVIAIAGVDCAADPASGEVIINSEALASIQCAEIALEDALVRVRLTRPGSASARWAGDRSEALAALARAQERAQLATLRAERLADDLARLPGLLRLAQAERLTAR